MMWTRFLIAAVAVCGISVAGWRLYEAGIQKGQAQVQQMWDKEKALTAEAHAEEMMKARQRELALQGLADRLRRENANEAKRLSAQYRADLERLRDRPEERAGAGGVPDSPGAGVGCTGEGLSRPDSEFLVWIGSEAARLQLAYNECRAKYNALIDR